MEYEKECTLRIVVLGKTGEAVGRFHNYLLPKFGTLPNYMYNGDFQVFRDVSFQDNYTQMHELQPGLRTRRESSMDLDSSLDLTDSSLPLSSIHHHDQPHSVDSGPHALIGNIVTSSSTMPEPVSSNIHDIHCDIVYLPLDIGINDQALHYCVSRTTLIILIIDSNLHTSPTDRDREYQEIFQMLTTVSDAHNTPYNIVLTGSSDQKNEFGSVRQFHQYSPEFGNIKICEDNFVIDQFDAVSKLCDMLRQQCSNMGEQRIQGPVGLKLFEDEETSSSQNRSIRAWEDIAKALKAYSLVMRQFRLQGNTGSKVNMQIFRSALFGTDLNENLVKHMSDLVHMGCLIPCYSLKGKAEKGSYNILRQSTFDLINYVMNSANDLRYSPVLRIKLINTEGHNINISPLMISYIVSESMKSWDLARQGNKDLIFSDAVAFTARNNDVRLNVKIKSGYMYLTVFYFSNKSKMDKKHCQTLLAHVEKAMKNLYTDQVRVDYSIRCVKTEGSLDGETGWMDVDDMCQCGTEFYNCSAHDTLIPHRVPLTETLHLWFSDLNEQDVEQGSPDSSITSRDLPCAALPEIAGCFGNNWNLFFVTHGLSNVEVERIEEAHSNLQVCVHECLKLMRRMERWKGKLSFKSFKTLVTKYHALSFDFEKYDSIVEEFNDNQN